MYCSLQDRVWSSEYQLEVDRSVTGWFPARFSLGHRKFNDFSLLNI